MKYTVDYTNNFKKQYKKAKKQGKDLAKLYEIVEKLAKGEKLEDKYKDHQLINDKNYKNCRECHIESNWLLIYQLNNNELIVLLFSVGSHSELFNK